MQKTRHVHPIKIPILPQPLKTMRLHSANRRATPSSTKLHPPTTDNPAAICHPLRLLLSWRCGGRRFCGCCQRQSQQCMRLLLE